MKKIFVGIILMFACDHEPLRWEGIPDSRQCSDFEDNRIAVCVSGGQQYTCIAERSDGCHDMHGVVMCSLGTAADATRQMKVRSEENDQMLQQQQLQLMNQ